MMKKITLILVGACLLNTSCGKKINNSDGDSSGGGDRNSENRQISDTLRRFVDKQAHVCEDELHCNESIAKLLVIDRQNVRYCTASLVGSDILLTSSSCLPKGLRVPGLDCSLNIFAIFPKTTFLKKKVVHCKQIVSSDTNEDVDPALWRSDFAFIKLSENVDRKKLKISTRGMKEDLPYRAYKVDFENDYEASQKLNYCFPVYNSYANPFATERYSPLVTVRDCQNVLGNSGAPLLDFSGEIVGLFSGGLDKGVGTYVLNTDLMIEPMAPLFHAANTSCLKLPSVLDDKKKRPECNKTISRALLDKYRSELLSSKTIHHKNMDDIKYELEKPIKYFKWKVDFFIDAKGVAYEPHFVKPKCFFDIKTWIGEFKRVGRIRSWATIKVDVPDFLLQTKLDRKLKPVSYVAEKGTKSYSVSFNPKYAYYQGNTIVQIESSFDGRDQYERYEDITDSCSP